MAAVPFRSTTCRPIAGAEGEAAFLDVRAGLTQMGGLVDSYDPKARTAVESDPRHKGAVIRVPTRPLADILDGHGLTQIDYGRWRTFSTGTG